MLFNEDIWCEHRAIASELNTVFDLKKQHLCRKISKLIDGEGKGIINLVAVWFLLFNGISTLFRLINAKAILLEEQ